jgi:hypothetical protein
MTRIVRTTYRCKRPPKRKEPAAIEVSEVVTVRDRNRTSDPKGVKISYMAAGTLLPTKSAIVTIRRPSRFGVAEDLTPEERNRRADADAMLQDFKRQIAEKLRERKP